MADNQSIWTTSDEMLMVAQVVPSTQAEGPGIRTAIWLQGCPLRCPGCCNPEMLRFEGGVATPISDLKETLLAAKKNSNIEGFTLMGGEPFSQPQGSAILAEFAQENELSVMIFSGFTIEELREKNDSDVDRLLEATDILVDGPYQRELPDQSRRWIGSQNQRIHFLTDRYGELDACWKESDTLEIRLQDGEVSVNGFPAANAVGFWRRPKKS